MFATNSRENEQHWKSKSEFPSVIGYLERHSTCMNEHPSVRCILFCTFSEIPNACISYPVLAFNEFIGCDVMIMIAIVCSVPSCRKPFLFSELSVCVNTC